LIHSAILGYYSKNGRVPQELKDSTTSYISDMWTDPETDQAYEYAVVSNTSYKLCTTFSTDSTEAREDDPDYYPYYYEEEGSKDHKKGYDCITYDIPESYIASYAKKIAPIAPPAAVQ